MNQNEYLISPLITTQVGLDKEYKKRLNSYDCTSVAHKLVEDYVEAGWEALPKPLKYKTRMKKLKTVDERLENGFWCLLKALGYKEMNPGRSFKIKIRRPPGETLEKQIDVFAKDDETVIVAECKASNKLSKRYLQKDLEEFANLKGPISNEINKHYNQKLKIVWMFVTKNIIWSKPDKERANGENIKIVTEKELNYYWTITQHLGPAARYQFLAEFLKNQQIPELKDKKIPAIRGKLGGQIFYSFVSTPRNILKIAFVNHRMLNDPDGAPSYQRLIEKKRLKQIGCFVERGGYFPTNILVNFVAKCRFEIVHKNEEAGIHFGNLFLPDKFRSAWIIDGQHRLYGYSNTSDKHLDDNIAIIAFENLSKEEEANLFVTINHEQKSVAKGLLDELEGELKWGSKIPTERIGSIASRLISVLSSDVNQPFYEKIGAHGEGRKKEKSLTVTAIKEALVKSGMLGKAILRFKEYEPGCLCGIDDSTTLDKARGVINYYFDAIRESNFDLWEQGREGYLCNNTGVYGHILLLASIIKYYEQVSRLNVRELTPDELFIEVQRFIEPICKYLTKATTKSMEDDFKVQYGSSGPRQYFYRLCKLVRASFTDFCPEGYLEWEETQNQEKIEEADKRIKKINSNVGSLISKIFIRLFGKEQYIEKAIGKSKPDIILKAMDKRLKEGKNEVPLEAYFDFIDFKKIVEIKDYWQEFKVYFDIPEPDEKGLAKNIKWMDRINELRRLPAHSSEQRAYEPGDFEYIEYIYTSLMKRIEDDSHASE